MPLIDKSKLAIGITPKPQKAPLKRMKTGLNKANVQKLAWYLELISQLPCIITGRYGVQVCHLAFALAMLGKPGNGMGIKADDIWVLPMIFELHSEQHSMNEVQFYRKYFGPHGEVLAACLCLALWHIANLPGLQDHEKVENMTLVIVEFRRMKI